MKSITYHWFIPFLVLLIAQSDPAYTQGTLPVEEIEVIKHFDARLIETKKVELFPVLPDADTSSRQYTYDLSLENPPITYLPPQIRPLAVRPETPPPSYKGHLRAGYGAPNAALGNLSYHLAGDGPLQLLVTAHHHSANNKQRYLQRFSDSGGALDAGYVVSPALAVQGRIAYDYDRIYYYGLRENDFFPYTDESRDFKLLSARAGISNPEPTKREINYSASLGFYNLQDDLGTKEDGLDLRAGGEKWFAGRHVLALHLIGDLSTLSDTEEKRNLNNLMLQPAFTYHHDRFSAKAGLNLAIHEAQAYIFPDVALAVRLSGYQIIAFAEATGDLRKNNLRTLTDYNPFVHQRIDTIRNTEYRSYAAGVKGRINKIEYSGKAGYSTVKHLALFLPDRFDYRKFQPLYDDGSMIRIEGVVKTDLLPNVQAGASVAKLFYDLGTEEEPWHLPSFEASLFATCIALNNKLQLRGAVNFENGVPYRDNFGDVYKLNALIDISFGADYYITRHIGVFLHANNLADNRRERWVRYPTFGINGVAGVLVRI